MSEAIIIVGANRQAVKQAQWPGWAPDPAVGGEGLVTLEILGQSLLQRTVAELKKAEVGGISVYAGLPLSSGIDDVEVDGPGSVTKAWQAAGESLRRFARNGAESVLIIELSAYIELDFAELLRLHQECGKAVTRAFHETGPMSLWVVNPVMLPDIEEVGSMFDESKGAEFSTAGYVNRLETPADLRRLVNDGLGGRCQFRPQGFEVKPGIWIAPGAQVEKAARLVAPAFIGRGVSIGDECLITRGSNVESNSEVDYGTTIEDSSILSNTYVGIGLDLSHSIAQGSSLLNLQHNVLLQISDPAVMRQNKQLSAGDRNTAFDLGTGEAVAMLTQDR